MLEEQTARFLDLLRPAISLLPPTAYVGVLLGVINCAVFYLTGLGRGFRLFVPYLILGAAGAVAGAMVGRQLPETGPLLGDVSVVATCVSTWTILLIARSMRL